MDNFRIWRASVEPNNVKIPLPSSGSNRSNQSYTKTCLRAHANDQVEKLNREILSSSQSFNSTAKSFVEHNRSLSQSGSPISRSSIAHQDNTMAPKFVSQKYNSPIELYSMNNIKKTLEAHSELIAPGVKGINFLKTNEPVNKQSEVYKLVMEGEDKLRAPVSHQPQHQQQTASLCSGQAQALSASSNRQQQERHDQKSQAHVHYATDRPQIGESSRADLLKSPSFETRSEHLRARSTSHSSAPRCCECGQPVVGPFAKLQDLFIHPHCFNCTTCGTSLKNSGYFSINDKLYCDIHARHVANVMRHNYNFEPNKLGHQPAPNPTGLVKSDQRDFGPQRSQSTSSLFVNQQVGSAAANDESTVSQQCVMANNKQPLGIEAAKQAESQADNCRCWTNDRTTSRATIATMFSKCKMASDHCCSCSCHKVTVSSGGSGQRELVLTLRPDAGCGPCSASNLVGSNYNMSHRQQFQQEKTNAMGTVSQTSTSGSCGVRTTPMPRFVTNHEHHEQKQSLGSTAVCCNCNGRIRGPYILAGKSTWCKLCSQSHLVCCSCKRSLLNCGFIELDKVGNYGATVEDRQQYCCEVCYENQLAPQCSKCSRKIRGDCLNALGKQWHPTCFVCGHCKQPFGNGKFYLEDQVPYCQKDWNLLFTTKCAICSYPIEAGDKWIEALNKNYHSDCFRCTMCQLKLEGQAFYCKSGKPYCRNHAK